MDINTKTNPHTEYRNKCISVSYFKDNVACGVNDEWTMAHVQCVLSSVTVLNKHGLNTLLSLLDEVYDMGRSHLRRDFQNLMNLKPGNM